MMTISTRTLFTTICATLLALCTGPSLAEEPRVLVSGSAEQIIAEFESNDYWGEIPEGDGTSVAPYLTVAVVDTWDEEAASLPVDVKKELFYRSLLPMILYSNERILGDREKLSEMAEDAEKLDRDWLETLAHDYRILDRDAGEALPEDSALKPIFDDLLARVDAIPPSLALGQAAYESGYGTSRFAREGNALFGQWVYGGSGMAPKEKRASKGNYGVAAYDWPLASVQAYMQNLNAHQAYASLREKRGAERAAGRTASGAALADMLTKYSEKGAEYVKTLKGIMKANDLAIADTATLRDEPVIVIVDVESEDKVAAMEAEIEELRTSGKLAGILTDMGVGSD